MLKSCDSLDEIVSNIAKTENVEWNESEMRNIGQSLAKKKRIRGGALGFYKMPSQGDD